MTVRDTRSLGWRALRATVVGLAVWGTLALAMAHESDWKSERFDFFAIVGGLQIGVPGSLVVAPLVAWALRLRRPWALPLAGWSLACMSISVSAQMFKGMHLTVWGSAVLIVPCFTVAELIMPGGRERDSSVPEPASADP